MFHSGLDEGPLPIRSSEVVPSLKVLWKTKVECPCDNARPLENAAQQDGQESVGPPPDEHGIKMSRNLHVPRTDHHFVPQGLQGIDVLFVVLKLFEIRH